jgi:hypothetical protein
MIFACDAANSLYNFVELLDHCLFVIIYCCLDVQTALYCHDLFGAVE